MANIVLINPRFEASYWGLEYALPLLGKRANLPVSALPLLAALTPAEHTITGMVVQRTRMTEILSELKERGAFTVVGGPWVSVKEDYFGDLADVIFVGE